MAGAGDGGRGADHIAGNSLGEFGAVHALLHRADCRQRADRGGTGGACRLSNRAAMAGAARRGVRLEIDDADDDVFCGGGGAAGCVGVCHFSAVSIVLD